MIHAYAIAAGRLVRVADPEAEPARAVWFDLVAPSVPEEQLIERLVGVGIPNREEMEEIEISSRLYLEDGAAFLTLSIVANGDSDDVRVTPVTFALAGPHLITIRYDEPKPFAQFPARAERASLGCTDADGVLVALLDALVDRLADILERASREVEVLSREVFGGRSGGPTAGGGPMPTTRDLQHLLEQIGRKGTLASSVRESLLTLQRAGGFLAHVVAQRTEDRETRARVKTLARDVQSLLDHVTYLAQNVQFLLDATLGLVSIEQNAIIKIFSVAAVVFLPPTLVASVYGMNFEHMPELRWMAGYPMALGLMVLSALLPYWYFKRKGWL